MTVWQIVGAFMLAVVPVAIARGTAGSWKGAALCLAVVTLPFVYLFTAAWLVSGGQP